MSRSRIALRVPIYHSHHPCPLQTHLGCLFPVILLCLETARPIKGLDYRWTRLASCALFRLFASLAVTVLIETGDDENVALVGSDITVPVFIVLSCMRSCTGSGCRIAS